MKILEIIPGTSARTDDGLLYHTVYYTELKKGIIRDTFVYGVDELDVYMRMQEWFSKIRRRSNLVALKNL